MRIPLLARAAERFARTSRVPDEKVRHERERQQRKADLIGRRAEMKAAKQRAESERIVRKQQAEARIEADRRALDAVAANAYERYMKVRDRIRHTPAASEAASVALTRPEQQMVAALEHLWDASSATIANLRRWCEPITGVRAGDYEPAPAELTMRLARDIGFLRRQLGRDLFVPEPPILGGFGCLRHGERYNEDTVRYFKALVALHDGGVLEDCRGMSERRVVWEIGAGWGGFAYQFKTVCPNVTYVMTGLPELLLVASVYLMAAFPDARCRFVGEAPGDVFWRDWQEVDFVFAPEAALPALHPPRIDLTLDIMTLRNMSESRVRDHVQRSFTLGSRYFYSLLPGAAATAGTPSAWSTIERLFWAHPVPPRVDPALVDDETGAAPDHEYAHVVGWRRIRV